MHTLSEHLYQQLSYDSRWLLSMVISDVIRNVINGITGDGQKVTENSGKI